MEALAIEGAVNMNITLLHSILQAIKNVRQFRQQCSELGEMVTVLLHVMDPIKNNDSSIAGSSQVAKSSAFSEAETWVKLKVTLDETQDFITMCTKEWNIWQRGWEVIVTKRLPRLKQKIYKWIALCMMETSASMKNELLKFKSDMQIEFKNSMQDITDTQEQNNIRRFGQLQAEQRQRKVEEPINIRFPEGDPRLQISNLDESPDLLASLKGVGRVICKQIKNDGIWTGRSSRNVEIYQLISNTALLEIFYGIAELGGKRYAVMEDLRDEPTLAAMIDSNELNDHLTRLHLAYEVASAVAYLHSVDVVVKNIGDVNIVLKKKKNHRLEDGRKFRPCLINLENSRKIMEETSLAECDVRFESPEYYVIRNRHSRNSDVWSLGVVIWECIVGTFPFSASPTSIASKENKSVIRQKLASGMLPWTVETDRQGYDDVYSIVHSCWNSHPTLRPPAPYVAQTLLDFYTQRSLGAPSSIDEVPGEVQGSIFEKICSKRNGFSTVTDISIEDALRLKRSVDKYSDPRNSCLLGAAIWWKLVPVEEFADSFSAGRLVSEYTGNNLEQVKRARVALSYLENSVDDASTEAASAHAVLAKHFMGKSRD